MKETNTTGERKKNENLCGITIGVIFSFQMTSSDSTPSSRVQPLRVYVRVCDCFVCMSVCMGTCACMRVCVCVSGWICLCVLS